MAPPTRGREGLDQVDGDDLADWAEDPWDASLGVDEVEDLPTEPRPAKWVLYGALVLVNLLVIGGGFYGWWYIHQANPPGEVGPPVEFMISEGETLSEISERLEDEGIVANAGFFRRYADDRGGLEGIEPGLYRLPTSDHVGNVLARLRTPPSETYVNVTFPEGYTLQQMAHRVAELVPQFDEEEFLAAANNPDIPAGFRPQGTTNLEGLLFPATYRISNADSEAQVVTRMVEQMERVARQQEEIEAGPRGVRFDYTPYEILIIASMIEREAKTDEDRRLIARVIYNRLGITQPLEIDATLLYRAPQELVSGESPNWEALRARDTPYNTYRHTGLPPTPIANPGRASIEAALNPAPNPSAGNELCTGVPRNECMWRYYVLKDANGNHAFAVTFEQHEENVQRAREAGLLN